MKLKTLALAAGIGFSSLASAQPPQAQENLLLGPTKPVTEAEREAAERKLLEALSKRNTTASKFQEDIQKRIIAELNEMRVDQNSEGVTNGVFTVTNPMGQDCKVRWSTAKDLIDKRRTYVSLEIECKIGETGKSTTSTIFYPFGY